MQEVPLRWEGKLLVSASTITFVERRCITEPVASPSDLELKQRPLAECH